MRPFLPGQAASYLRKFPSHDPQNILFWGVGRKTPDYKKLMGIEKDGYPKFRDFNQRVIKEPVAEINRVSEESLEGHTVGLQALTTIPTA